MAPRDSQTGCLNVGVLVDALTVPRWVHYALSQLRAAADHRLVLVAAVGTAATARPSRRLARVGTLMYRAYTRVDRAWFRVESDPFDPVDVRAGLRTDVAVLDGGHGPERMSAGTWIQRIGDYDLDVLIAFTSALDLRPFRECASRGVWFFAHGHDRTTATGPSGFWETMRGDLVGYTTLCALRSGSRDAGVLATACAAVSPVSVTRTNHDRWWQAAMLVPKALATTGDARDAEPVDDGSGTAGSLAPRNLRVLGCLARLSARLARRRMGTHASRTQWFLAWGVAEDAPNPYPSVGNLHHVAPPADRFWADPFPVVHDGKRYLFFEEFLYARGKGHIAVIEVDAGVPEDAPATVLACEHHLAYPFVFTWQGAYFMLPDSGADRGIDLYRCLEFPGRWTFEARVLDDVYAADPTLVQFDGSWWLFACISHSGASPTDALHLYRADSPLGPWTPHRANPVKLDVRSARPAGRLFSWRGDLYRPAQDCSGTYGRAVRFQKVLRLDTEGYEEVEVSTLQPDWAPRLTATHTYNAADGWLTLDGAVRQPRARASLPLGLSGRVT